MESCAEVRRGSFSNLHSVRSGADTVRWTLQRQAGHRYRGNDGQQHLALAVQRVDVLFLKIDLHAVFFQFSDGGQRVHSISGKAGDALGDDQVDFARLFDTM